MLLTVDKKTEKFSEQILNISINESMTNSNDKLAKLAINKSLLKEYRNSENDRIVYLKDGDEFQIQIFNPYQYVIGVSFTFNSDNVDNSRMLVLKPGERVWLDRYLNENRKLKFWTYKVNNSEEVKKAIEKNGILNIYFYKEIEKNNYTIWNNNTYIYDGGWKSPIDDINGGIRYFNNALDDSVKLSNSINAINYCDANISASSLGTSGISDYSCTSALYSTATTEDVKGCADKYNASHKVSSKSIETGRIDKGGYSNQKFTNYYGDFQSWYFKKETIKILPESQKQISASDLAKKYCYNCGKKIKKEFKFCPSCGANQY